MLVDRATEEQMELLVDYGRIAANCNNRETCRGQVDYISNTFSTSDDFCHLLISL